MEYGRGDTTEAENYMGNSFTLLVGTGLFLTVLGLLIYKPVLYLFGASDITFPLPKNISVFICWERCLLWSPWG